MIMPFIAFGFGCLLGTNISALVFMLKDGKYPDVSKAFNWIGLGLMLLGFMT